MPGSRKCRRKSEESSSGDVEKNKQRGAVQSMGAGQKSITLDISNYFTPLENEIEKPEQSDKTEGYFITEDRLGEIIDHAISRAIEKLIPFLKDTFKIEIDTRCDFIEGTIHDMNLRIDNLDSSAQNTGVRVEKCEELSEQLSRTHRQIRDMSDKMATLTNNVNNLEQYTRKSNIRIFGVKEEEHENCSEKVVAILREKLNVDLQTDDIDATHRIGRKNVTGEKNRTRPIIVRLLRRFTKSTIMKNKNKLKGSGISMFDDLTAVNSQLLFHAKQHPGIESAWVFNGKVFAQD